MGELNLNFDTYNNFRLIDQMSDGIVKLDDRINANISLSQRILRKRNSSPFSTIFFHLYYLGKIGLFLIFLCVMFIILIVLLF
jgi:hypothetical protein